MCGKLARYLRLCGHDAAYVLDDGIEDDDSILAWAVREERTLLTRDEDLAAGSDDALLLRGREIEAQLRELRAAGFDVSIAERPRRCGRCNGRLEPVASAAATPAYAPDPETTDCWRCTDCNQFFWKGSHWDDVRERIENL